MGQLHTLMSAGESAGHRLDALRALVGREFRMRYKGSFFGIIWAILNPLGTVVVLQYVFTRILSIETPHFAAFIYSGLLPWVWFSTAVQTGASTLVDNRDLVRTPFFPRPLLPWAVTCTNFLLYLIALPVLLTLILAEGLPLTPALLALPAIWIVLGVLTLGVTVLIAAIGVIVRDVQHLIGVVLVFWFYLTPIFYDLKQVPDASTRWFALNPMASLVSAHRAVTLYGQFPDWRELGYWVVGSACFLALSLLIFRGLEDGFVEEA